MLTKCSTKILTTCLSFFLLLQCKTSDEAETETCEKMCP
jgi:hypothetical protein